MAKEASLYRSFPVFEHGKNTDIAVSGVPRPHPIPRSSALKQKRPGTARPLEVNLSNISLNVSVIVLKCLYLENPLLRSLNALCASLCGSHRCDVGDVLADRILTDIGVIVS